MRLGLPSCLTLICSCSGKRVKRYSRGHLYREQPKVSGKSDLNPEEATPKIVGLPPPPQPKASIPRLY